MSMFSQALHNTRCPLWLRYPFATILASGLCVRTLHKKCLLSGVNPQYHTNSYTDVLEALLVILCVHEDAVPALCPLPQNGKQLGNQHQI